MAKTIITAALTGAVTPAGYHIPETPEQIVQAAYECWALPWCISTPVPPTVRAL